MRLSSRSLLAATAGVALFGLAGCFGGADAGGGKPSGQPSGEQGSALASLDPCTIMKPDQLTAAGLPTAGTPANETPSEPGCTYAGDTSTIGIYRAAGTSFDAYSKQQWKEFTRVAVNGRPAANAKKPEFTDDMCVTLMSSGGGTIQVHAGAADPRKPFNGCAESLKIAKQIEPSLPK